ncbi:ATP-binding protein [Marinilongibacter aquaticus]|uniref:sensor histidine kinase n=1 Tax=Marinilongibacter aquaticus TaxID=2975157 RepID=UPI0021BD2A96|nr:ATP-binding protein [Marinilongibacter aquaticus]UBM60090.1 ATP-binding protein [Marinilongibacter aquaticus]
MNLSPRWIAFFLALFITILTVTFLSFMPKATAEMLLVTGASCFVSTFLTAYYTVDVLVFQEVNQIYKKVKKLKIKDFNIKRKSLFNSENPLKLLNLEISDYVSEKQKEIEELKRMEAFRREFLADVSHELKTPIFAAQGFVHTLLDGAKDDPEVLTRFLKKAAKSLDGLDALVRDLVVLSQVETGELKMQFEVVDLVHITEDIFDQLEDKADSRGTKLQIRPTKLKHCLVVADPQRIYQVLTNFVDNAIKYGKEKGRVNVIFEEQKKSYAITIEDDGPGIAKEHLNRIFERFYRIDKSRSRETGGTGLGLAIVKHILNAHNSAITVSSKPGKGTRFTFHLTKAD